MVIQLEHLFCISCVCLIENSLQTINATFSVGLGQSGSQNKLAISFLSSQNIFVWDSFCLFYTLFSSQYLLGTQFWKAVISNVKFVLPFVTTWWKKTWFFVKPTSSSKCICCWPSGVLCWAYSFSSFTFCHPFLLLLKVV